jgi:hypothetical protein
MQVEAYDLGVTSARERELDAAVDDALVMLAFAARRGIDIETEEATAILALRDHNGHAVEPAVEASFWRAVSAIAKRVLPATPASIRATRDLPVPQTDKTAKAYVRWSFGVLALLATAQTYTVVGNALVEQITVPVPAHVGGAITPAGVATDGSETGSDAAAIASTVPSSFIPLPVEVPDVVGVHDAVYRELQRWNAVWVLPVKGLVYGGRGAISWITRAFRQSGVAQAAETGAKTSTSLTPMQEEFLKTSEIRQRALSRARFMIDALQRFVLPFLYGFLGACVFILRRMSVEIEESSFKSTIEFRIRRWLGGLAGVAIGFGLLGASNLGITPAALAFLAGYSVEVIISAMDRFVSTVSQAIGPRSATT